MIKVVAGILFNKKNEILIAKRPMGRVLGGFWEFPGGKVEDGEKFEDTIIREFKEEMDVDIKINEFLGENAYDYGKFQINLIAYTGIILNGEVKLNVHDEYRWVSIEELKEYNFAPADVFFVDKLIKNNFNSIKF